LSKIFDDQEEAITWECWCKIDSKFYLAWEYIYSVSVIYLAFNIAYDAGTWDMAMLIRLKLDGNFTQACAGAVIIFDMVM
jgi:hypothetical protein